MSNYALQNQLNQLERELRQVQRSFFVGFWLLILAFAGVGYGAFTLLTNKSKRKQIEMSCDESKKATSAAMRQLFAEFKQYQKELDEYDAYHDRILDEIHKV